MTILIANITIEVVKAEDMPNCSGLEPKLDFQIE